MPYRHPQGNVFYRHLGEERPKIAYGEGIYLYDEDGRCYLDGSGGPFVVNVGHGRQEVVNAMGEQARKAAYIHAPMFTSEPLERYSAALASVVPLDDPRFYYMSSGSEVVEGAVKLARQIQMARGDPGRTRIISRRRSYHGITFGALGIGDSEYLKAPYLNLVPDPIHIDPPYPYRDSRNGEALAALLEEEILKQGRETVAAFIAEPISGAGLGAVVPPDDYWPAVRAVCDRYGVLLIVDEVLVGMGRTGQWWGINHWNVQPDILLTSKGLAGGYFPLGFFAGRREHIDLISRELGDFNHGGTFSHHAVGAAAGLAVLEIIQREDLINNAARQGDHLASMLAETFADHPQVGDIRGRGLFWGLELVADKETKEPHPRNKRAAQTLWRRAFEMGLITYYSQGCVNGTDGDVIMVGPPLIIDRAGIEEMVRLLRTAFDAVFSSD